MGWFDLPRVPEPEVMDEAGEVEAYSSAAAQTYLSQIDNRCVDHALKLVANLRSASAAGSVLDVGTGPGQIALKLAARLPGWMVIGVDRSPNMIRQALAARGAASAQELDNTAAQIEFLVADANRLPFADDSFNLVICNSVLHHFGDPAKVLAEIARVAGGDGAILVRDIARPSRIAYPIHSRWFGRHYSGKMYRLYCDSLRSAYTIEEISALLRQSPIHGANAFRRGRTHLGIERDGS